MDRIDILKKISETLNNEAVLRDYMYRDLNWVHAIRILIFNYENRRYANNNVQKMHKEEISHFESPPISSAIKEFIKKIIPSLVISFKKRIFKIFKRGYHLVDYVITLSHFYLYSIYVRIIKKAETVNFLLDNFDVKYGEYYFNPYSDNINLNENAVNLCIPVWGRSAQIKKTYFKTFDIGKTRIAHMQIFSRNSVINTSFLNPLKEILDEAEFDYIKCNIEVVYKNYLFFIFVLKQLKPRQIFLYDSYNIFSLGLIGAGKKLGILTIEQQHGVIYPLHPGYCYNYSHEGQIDFICHQLHYYTAPLIDEVRKGWSFHPELIEIPSSPAVQVWTKFKDTSENSILQKLKIITSGTKVVTFGLGNELLPEWIVNSLLELTDEYFVCFRLHPRYSNVNRNQIIELQKKIPNSDFEISSSISLFDLLEISDFFLSDGSTTMLDALQFKLKCICFSDVFADSIFQPYIRQNLLLLTTTRDQLVRILK